MVAQLQGDAREADIELYPDDNNIYRWTAYLQACTQSLWCP